MLENKQEYKNSLTINHKNKHGDKYLLATNHKDRYKHPLVNDNKEDNIIYYPSSTKEWFNSIYSYNKSYSKTLITKDTIINNLFKSYFNMFEIKKKFLYKRRHTKKNHNTANRIYVSRAEVKHSSTKLTILLYIYNKQNSIFEGKIRKLIQFIRYKKYLDTITDNIKKIKIYKNRLDFILKKFTFTKKWKIICFKKTNNLLKNITLKIRKKFLISHKMYRYNRWLKKVFEFEQLFIKNANLINFNNFKFNSILLNLKDLGLVSLLCKIYGKRIKIKIIELKSIHLNSDVFSKAVALKLKDRKNKAVRVLRRAIIQMVKIPDFHTLITFYDNVEDINKNNILNVIKQQVVSGLRFEAKGRLTRRLTAMRAVFKYRYTGSLKNVSSSFNKKSTTILRGYIKSNLEYTIINSKTRNGSFGLKGWVSSH